MQPAGVALDVAVALFDGVLVSVGVTDGVAATENEKVCDGVGEAEAKAVGVGDGEGVAHVIARRTPPLPASQTKTTPDGDTASPRGMLNEALAPVPSVENP